MAFRFKEMESNQKASQWSDYYLQDNLKCTDSLRVSVQGSDAVKGPACLFCLPGPELPFGVHMPPNHIHHLSLVIHFAFTLSLEESRPLSTGHWGPQSPCHLNADIPFFLIVLSWAFSIFTSVS